MLRVFRSFLTYLNLTSLDAPLVVTVWYWALAFQYQHQPPSEIVWLLFSTTWMVYALDRLFESEVSLSRARHRFHRRHRHLFLIIISLLGVLNCILIWCVPLPVNIYKGGIVLGAASVAYILQPHLSLPPLVREWLKNLLVTFVFASGAILPVWIHLLGSSPQDIPISFWLNAISLFALTLSGLRSIEIAENPDITGDFTPVVTLLLLIAFLFLNDTVFKWAWICSAISNIALLKYIPNAKLSPGIFDFVLLFPAGLILLILKSGL